MGLLRRLRNVVNAPKKLEDRHIDACQQFLMMSLDCDELIARLEGMFTLDFGDSRRLAHCSFLVPEPGVQVRRIHILRAVEMCQQGVVTVQNLMQWATVLLLNEAFEFEVEDSEWIADVLNDLSFNSPKLEMDQF